MVRRFAIPAALMLVASPLAGQDHAGMDHGQMDHSGHVMPESPMSPGSGDEPGDAPPPPVPTDFPGMRFFPAERMTAARAAMVKEMDFNTFALQVDRLEYRAGKGGDGFGWEGQAWYGGDIDRIVVASEGEGTFGERAERIELSAYWRHALDPWFNLQLGVRQDFRPDPQRSYALVGIEGLAPYWFEIGGQLLVSDKGDLHARGKAGYQQRITQSLVLEPEAEVDFAFQDVPELAVGAGFERIELGARLRYERNRSLAPYLGVNWERKLGETARLARASGEGASGVSAVFGIRAMF
ncbi:MAG: copper resistance protein B [Novosphingobium pentaromativorans]|uniref:Copper resistance protein B n=1 Tax=Novosphingobium pentaromativorans TaxID=205844 RepID=A0A2W5NER6_9SPHN|nr:copper resistance protein B [Novosphingobium panipatense]PZQ51982.1 MAG: copper resistance protein B [Novosphingobium pentaromativorans]